jgi:hypothetical protein
LRSNNEHALAVGDRCHCLHTIDSKIDDHLLQLDSISAHQEQARRGLEARRDAMPTRLVPHEADLFFGPEGRAIEAIADRIASGLRAPCL